MDASEAKTELVLPAIVVPPAPRISKAANVILFIALLAFFLEIVLKGAVLAGFLSAFVLGVAESPLLNDAGALDSDFQAALGLAILLPMAAASLAIGWRTLRWLGTKLFNAPPAKRRWWGSWWSVALLAWIAFGYIVLLPLDRAKLVDTDDSLLGGTLLAAAVFLGWLVTWNLLRLGWWCSRKAWLVSQTRPVLAGMIIVVAFGSSGTVWLIGEAAEILRATLPNQPQLASNACDQDPVNCARQVLLTASHSVTPAMASSSGTFGSANLVPSNGPGSGAGGGDDGNSRVTDCVRALNAEPPSPSAVGEAMQSYRDEEVVRDTVTAVCLRHGRRPIMNLRPYFFRSLKHAWRRKQETNDWNRCHFVDIDSCSLEGTDDASLAAQARAVSRMFCELSEQDQEVLRLRFVEDLDGPALAYRLGISHAAARQRLSTALERLRKRFPELCQ